LARESSEDEQMAGELVPLVLIPRYTTYAGATSFETIGMDITEYEQAILSFWRGAGVGMTSVTITCEESIDQLNWTTCGGGPFSDPGASTEGQFEPTFSKRWFRIKLTLAGSGPVLTCWCIGFLMRRES
jgi:hypothetical protein